MYRKYYSYNDMPTAIVPKQNDSSTSDNNQITEEKLLSENQYNDNKTEEDTKISVKSSDEPKSRPKLLDRFDNDDILLLGVIFLLLADGCDDDILLLTLGVIFFMDKK